jgi:type VI secretion system protein ImpG
MSSDLLTYYNDELRYLRELGRAFGDAHPDIAQSLKLDGSHDPFVERLIEGFAYLNARTRKKLDDDFPEIAEALLGVLYPHFLSPIPSMMIAQFELDASQASQADGFLLPRGTFMESEPIDGDPCRYQTCSALRLWPLRVAEAELVPVARAPSLRTAMNAAAVVRIGLKTFGREPGFGGLNLKSLRFFVKGPAAQANAIHELLCARTIEVALASGLNDREPLVLGADALQPAGFGEEDAALQMGERSFDGYRLLAEYFALPEKFRFFEIQHLNVKERTRFGQTVDLLIYLSENPAALGSSIQAGAFRLGCSTLVNRFPLTADPIGVTHAQSQYTVVPDVRRPRAMEILSIDRVEASTTGGQVVPVLPLFGMTHALDPKTQRAFWSATRREAGYVDRKFDTATEVDISLVDLDLNPSTPPDWTLVVHTQCCNRNLPSLLEFHEDESPTRARPRLQLEQSAPLTAIRVLTKPTPTRRAPLRSPLLWRMVSHLSLNHLSLTGGAAGATALRELLTLYDYAATPDRRARIDALVSVNGRLSTAFVSKGDAGFARGVDVDLELDEKRFADQGQYLFASVLERFLALYASVNSFTRLRVTSASRGTVLYEWPPRAGLKPLI